jgi:hypothetical protein
VVPSVACGQSPQPPFLSTFSAAELAGGGVR